MKFASFAIAALALALPTCATPQNATWSEAYDNPDLPLTNVACSNGANGLITQGLSNLGNVTTFPYVGGMFPVKWNSTLCGSCWELGYNGTTINFVAVDYAANGVNLSEEAMRALAGQDGVDAGKIQIDAQQVDASKCAPPTS